MWTIVVSETLGTMMLTLLGCSVAANVRLRNTFGHQGGWLLVSLGWGLGIFVGVYVAFASGAHLNPAVTFGILVDGAPSFAPGIPVTPLNTLAYLVGEFLGAFVGAVLCFLAYRLHFEHSEVGADKLAVFATAPRYRAYAWNVVTEAIATFVLVYVVLVFGRTPSGLGPLAVALVVVGIGVCLGGPTGFAINPARDLGPRFAHAVLPIKGKGESDWPYAWVPVVAPLVGGLVAGLLARAAS
ncbi:MIP/aquaporin family protein [Actinopolymorpha singaporensis]|uniref:Glycerol uptake facilitator protein n=1 Tax=Actinopolymorpha singaporensis TaxID=117157 RepID=A0A1H1XSP5_9ACTN|nr:MIP/aquaporin family protein [Actinopolymorpha singaporensis]SDT12240.1 glycerol uptake facilitator protein [Actinopolymorpha singaporensis]